MRAALVVHTVFPNPATNLATILGRARDAADSGAELVLFPEAALTGLINNDDPAHDLSLGQQIPGNVTEELAKLTREKRLWLGIGLLEREGNRLYDSAILLDPNGTGDLFDDAIVATVRALHLDRLLFPFARCFPDGSYDQRRWEREELPEYTDRIKSVGVTTLMTNYIGSKELGDGNSFGGAMAVSGDGTVIVSLPLGREGILIVDL